MCVNVRPYLYEKGREDHFTVPFIILSVPDFLPQVAFHQYQ